MPTVNCKHWTPGGTTDGGTCGLGLFGGTPSAGVCGRVCDRREPITEGPAVEPAPKSLIEKVSSFARALAAGKYVDDETRTERERICAACDKAKRAADGSLACSICGCGVSSEYRKVMRLTAYEELRDEAGRLIYGCRHPERAAGKGWSLPVVQPSSDP